MKNVTQRNGNATYQRKQTRQRNGTTTAPQRGTRHQIQTNNNGTNKAITNNVTTFAT